MIYLEVQVRLGILIVRYHRLHKVVTCLKLADPLVDYLRLVVVANHLEVLAALPVVLALLNMTKLP